jgi:hypothetical protein
VCYTKTMSETKPRTMWVKTRVGKGNKRPGSWEWREVPIDAKTASKIH